MILSALPSLIGGFGVLASVPSLRDPYSIIQIRPSQSSFYLTQAKSSIISSYEKAKFCSSVDAAKVSESLSLQRVEVFMILDCLLWRVEDRRVELGPRGLLSA